jgi:hypothetical protein
MADSSDPKNCVVLVPCGRPIEPDCDAALRALEARGYTVRRVPGYSAIDLARSILAADALRDGFDELLWVDSDVAFDPDAIDRLRAHRLPIVCGLYACKGRRRFACEFLPGSGPISFGKGGGLIEVLYAGFGFMHTRREVYDQMRGILRMPACNQRFGPPLYPWFLPTLIPDSSGHWYLGEDYAFCERARQCGFRVMADTGVRLWHIGSYAYSWEDAGADRTRYGTYTYHLRPPAKADEPPRPASD